MEENLAGHSYVKAAIDIACWDILGKAVNLPLCSLLGGRFGTRVPIYKSISSDDPVHFAETVKKFQKMGYTKFQCKIGSDPELDVEKITAAASVLNKGT